MIRRTEATADVFEILLPLKDSIVFSRFLRILIRSSSPGELVEFDESAMGIECEEEMVPDVPTSPGATKCPDLSRCCSTSKGG